jgi:hypothetical protein
LGETKTGGRRQDIACVPDVGEISAAAELLDNAVVRDGLANKGRRIRLGSVMLGYDIRLVNEPLSTMSRIL